MKAQEMPPVVANMKIRKPKLFIFYLCQFLQKRSSNSFSFNEILLFLETTQAKVANFEKNGELPLDWFVKLAETEGGRKMLSLFEKDIPVNYLISKLKQSPPSSQKEAPKRKKIDSNNSSERSLDMDIQKKDRVVVLSEAARLNVSEESRAKFLIGFQGLMKWYKNNSFSSNAGPDKIKSFENDGNIPPEWKNTILSKEGGTNLLDRFVTMHDDPAPPPSKKEELIADSIIGGHKEPRGAFISKDYVGKVLDKILELSNFKSDSEIGRFLKKGNRGVISAMRSGKFYLLYVEDVIAVARSKHVFCSEKSFLDKLGLLEHVPVGVKISASKKSITVNGINNPENIIGGTQNPQGVFISKNRAGDLLDMVLELTNLKSDRSVAEFLGRDICRIRKGTCLLYLGDLLSLAKSDHVLVTEKDFLYLLGIDNPIVPEKNDPIQESKKKMKPKIDKQKKPRSADEKKEISPTTDEQEIPTAPTKQKSEISSVKEILDTEIEKVVMTALIITGSITDLSIRREFFLGCLLSRLTEYDVRFSEKDNVVFFRKNRLTTKLNLDSIPFEFK